LIVKKWPRYLHSYLYFGFLEPFFSTATHIKRAKMLDWIRYSFDCTKAADHGDNEMINLARKPLADALTLAIDETGIIRNEEDDKFHK
jgi:sporulation-control protein spo0M